jgi:hypothetical protein
MITMRRFHYAIDSTGRTHHEEGRKLRGRRHRHEDVKEGRRGGGRGRKGGHGGRGGAQTFRRGRAIEFYKSLQSKEQTLIAQLEAKELQSINQMIAAELKAVQAIKAEFKITFGILEEELSDNEVTENEEVSDK